MLQSGATVSLQLRPHRAVNETAKLLISYCFVEGEENCENVWKTVPKEQIHNKIIPILPPNPPANPPPSGLSSKIRRVDSTIQTNQV
jgi:hypothetical protein